MDDRWICKGSRFLFGITRRIVKDNPRFLVVIALNLTIFRKRTLFSPYSYMVEIREDHSSSEDYNYFEKGWYKGARNTDTGVSPIGMRRSDVITTSYAVPVHGKEWTNWYLSVDLNRWLRDLVDWSSLTGYTVVTQTGTLYLAQEGRWWLVKICSNGKEARIRMYIILVNEMAAESGSIIVDDGEFCPMCINAGSGNWLAHGGNLSIRSGVW